MTRYVAFLRAVNVGRRRVDMATVRTVFESLGHGEVSTFLNTGNVVFSATGWRTSLTRPIERALADAFGFEVPTLLRSAAEVRALADRRPFGPIPEGATHMVVLLAVPLPPTAREALEARSDDRDQLVVDGTEIHWRIDGTVLQSGLKDRDWKVVGDQPTTARNHTVMVQLAAKLDG